jgi:hypothetical protein
VKIARYLHLSDEENSHGTFLRTMMVKVRPVLEIMSKFKSLKSWP